ncbi:MAG TPA: peptide chain release factor-like protein [Planctomycetota bacterium]|nr:peptide chain release factor-like protein [Planctomycetota bacterium]
MNLAGDLAVSPSKLKELRARMARLGIDPKAIEEKFVRGGGKGGQKINKTANCVQLRFAGIVVRCQRDRKRAVNRFLALRELVDRIEMKNSPGTSARLAEAAKASASKARAGRRARARHHPSTDGGEEE